MGWPVTRDQPASYPNTLDDLRKSAQAFGILHDYHPRPDDVDNDFYFRIGLIDPVLEDRTRQHVESLVRGVLASRAIMQDVSVSTLFFASYSDTTLPYGDTNVLSLTDAGLADNDIPSLYTLPTQPDDVTIYQQKYEIFRHFDKLRWQTPGIAFAIATGVVAISIRKETPQVVMEYLLAIMGFGAIMCAYTMRRIGIQIEFNRTVLDMVARRIGDRGIPSGPPRRGATGVFQISLWVAGVVSILLSIGLPWWWYHFGQ
jgi:hypothetical protein